MSWEHLLKDLGSAYYALFIMQLISLVVHLFVTFPLRPNQSPCYSYF